MESKRINRRLPDNMSVWAEFKELAEKFNCLSLSEGSTVANPPSFLQEELRKAIEEGHNQYCRNRGHPILTEAVAKFYKKRYQRDIDHMTEVIVGAGGVALLYIFTLALTSPGDEVVIFEPAFPVFFDHVKLAECNVKTAPLIYDAESSSWKIDFDLFRQAFSDKTKLLILNTPQSPTGKVFTKEELQTISDILDKEFPNVYILSDEVYELFTYDGAEHHRIAQFNNNWVKTISIFDGGKLMNCTGWNIAYGVGPSDIIQAGSIVLMAVQYCASASFQVAFGRSMEKAEESGYVPDGVPKELVDEIVSGRKARGESSENFSFIDYTVAEFESVRRMFISEFAKVSLPMKPLASNGGCYLLVDISELKPLIPAQYLTSLDYDSGLISEKITRKLPDGTIPLDLAVCRWLAKEKKVVAMPTSLFFTEGSKYVNDKTIRLALSRGLQYSKEAIQRLNA